MRTNLGILLCAALLAACSSNESAKSTSVGGGTYVSGRALKGVLNDASVKVYAVGIVPHTPLGEARTDKDGNYRVRLPDHFQGPLEVVVATTDATKITCDTRLGCKSQDGSVHIKGATHPASFDFTLSALLPKALPDSENAVQVTAFSTLAASLTRSKTEEGEPLNATQIAIANAKITSMLADNQMFDFDGRGDIIVVAPVDVTDENEIEKEVKAQRNVGLQFGFANAAIMRLAQEQNNGDVDAFLSDMTSSFVAHDGEIPLFKTSNTKFSIEALVDATATEVEEHNKTASDRARLPAQIETKLELAQNDINYQKQPPRPDKTPVEFELPGGLIVKLPDYDGEDAAGYIKEVGAALLGPVRTLAHMGTDAANAFTGVLTTATGTLLTAQLNDDATNLVGVAKQFYPKMGALIRAVIAMGMDQNATTYDLAQDPQHLLPEDLEILGTVTRTTSYQQVHLTLNNGYIEGLGDVTLELSASEPGYLCWFCGHDISFSLVVHGANGEITVRTDDFGWNRGYTYETWSDGRVLNSVYFSQLDTTISWNFGETTLSLSGKNSVNLYWWNGDMSLLPLVTSFSASGDYQRDDGMSEIQFVGMNMRYNLNSYFEQTELIDWAQNQADYFTLAVDLNVRIKDSTNTNDGTPIYHDVELECGMSRDEFGYYGSDVNQQWIKIAFDNESYIFSASQSDAPRYAFYTQSGAMMEMLMNNDGKTFENGFLKYRDHQIATINDSAVGPIVRFEDGTMQSF